ncbi:MAG: dsDNA-mimic protein [Rheinheimera sp.]|uniref:DUF440 family protein n=1 Tax=Arsukibacterium sp. UBA3155 TaxID=1946058 RepID=UPI000C98D6EC|nr:DUF440 family protein [Arsukibacterium sp. UBA3155]MAD74861.1 dsDNA-mimic protein [Rheinheimera sp.]|tara:strand:- start:94334 stop:94657 length:324 start_codon:yes stop_codon:yes gene_type:complete
MQDLEMWSLDELCDHAFDIFEELAPENLSAEDYNEYQQQYEQRGYVDLVIPGPEWVELTMQDLEPELHYEAQIGISGLDGNPDKVLARILLSREKHDALCHAQWRSH